MRHRRVAVQAVDDAGFRGVERDPVPYGELKGDEERLGPLHRVAAQFLPLVELDLKRQFADERPVLAARAPERDGHRRPDLVAEVERADVLQHFLDDGVADERNAFIRVRLDALERGEDLDYRAHGQDVDVAHIGAGKLLVVSVENANAAKLVLKRQRLALDLDAMVTEDLRPHVRFGSRLQVVMTKLEDNLGFPDREAVLIENATAQDEGVPVKPEVGGIHEQHFADPNRILFRLPWREPDAVFPGGLR